MLVSYDRHLMHWLLTSMMIRHLLLLLRSSRLRLDLSHFLFNEIIILSTLLEDYLWRATSFGKGDWRPRSPTRSLDDPLGPSHH